MDTSSDSSDPDVAYETVTPNEVERLVGFPKHASSTDSEDGSDLSFQNSDSLENGLPPLKLTSNSDHLKNPIVYQDKQVGEQHLYARSKKSPLQDKTNVYANEQNPFRDDGHKLGMGKRLLVSDLVNHFDKEAFADPKVKFISQRNQARPLSRMPPELKFDISDDSLPSSNYKSFPAYDPPATSFHPKALQHPAPNEDSGDISSNVSSAKLWRPSQEYHPSSHQKENACHLNTTTTKYPVTSTLEQHQGSELQASSEYYHLLVEKDKFDLRYQNLLSEHNRLRERFLCMQEESEKLKALSQALNEERIRELKRYQEAKGFYQSLEKKHDDEFELLAKFIRNAFEDIIGVPIDGYDTPKNNKSHHTQCVKLLEMLRVAIRTKERMEVKSHASDIQMLRRRMEHMELDSSEIKQQLRYASKWLEATYCSLIGILGGSVFVPDKEVLLTENNIQQKIQNGADRDAEWIHNGVIAALIRELNDR
ncbi:hypothetical protein KL918_000450 [Ogataea parapolymorpha]|uniref:Uncharacterized protein n=1 Tax=Ogataea parapolymorpha (strain ATCC 26012 / BCRC 20466 / JCM 22074 / NRRL Y-7560 / DL-1) TaxID=871575 RepID=W1Q8Z8_OGAPD|nr:hypothetical protein HPODL_03118 [Ogataea parapolymorpha DL-1]ESW96496.1 hypothetical protein HPODL_03118 [Ogataea parapolymorpha DL-1]KAG7870246.1 hypothetical protein KL918_000450 [Ogataea parapolymorpha]KAG7875195.1 hypothetical protein KL916_000807 [Ogataea parapolymorpha]